MIQIIALFFFWSLTWSFSWMHLTVADWGICSVVGSSMSVLLLHFILHVNFRRCRCNFICSRARALVRTSVLAILRPKLLISTPLCIFTHTVRLRYSYSSSYSLLRPFNRTFVLIPVYTRGRGITLLMEVCWTRLLKEVICPLSVYWAFSSWPFTLKIKNSYNHYWLLLYLCTPVSFGSAPWTGSVEHADIS